jgi:hypothetical protein
LLLPLQSPVKERGSLAVGTLIAVALALWPVGLVR